METILPNALIQKYKQLSGRCRAVFFSAPTGFGKTVAARALATGKRVITLSAREPALVLPSPDGTWGTLILDDLQDLDNDDTQKALCALLRDCPDRQFLLLSRGELPSWLMPFQVAGVLGLLTPRDLMLDREAAARLLQSHGVSLAQADLSAVCQEAKGYPLALELLAQRLERGEPCNRTTLDNTRLDLYRYYEEAVLRRLEPASRSLLMQVVPFEPVTLDLARLVTGDNHAGERMAALLRTTSMLQQDKLGSYRFWPLFRDFLLWELDQHTSDSQRRTLYARAGLHYELNEDYGRALDCYAHSGNSDKISELLEKNAEMHPGMGHYLEMEPYYRALPEEEVLQSPALMQGMSMLCAMRMDFAASERWYTALRDFAAHSVGDKAREAKGRLAWLDIGLPQRPVEATAELFPKVFALISARQIRLPPFSVTSTLPSLMNGGKDFSPWSKRDTLLYTTLRVPVEAVLGRDGVGLADCALAESQFEKGKDIRDQAIKLLAMQDRIRRDGTPDMEFAVVGLLARVQMDAGHPGDARESLLALRQRFVQAGETRFLPNLDAMLCRTDLLRLDDGAVAAWLRDEAPGTARGLQVLKRYQYFTEALVRLSLEDYQAVLVTLAPLEPYCDACRRIIDGIQLHTLQAIARYRLDEPEWKDNLSAALDAAREYGFVRTIGQFGAAVLPLLENCGWDADADFLAAVLAAARGQAVCYPGYLEPRQSVRAPLTETELQVVRLICDDRTNAEIGWLLDIKLSTVKTHVSHILDKLQVSRRSQIKATAQRRHWVDS